MAEWEQLATAAEDTLTVEAYKKLDKLFKDGGNTRVKTVMKACSNCKDLLPEHWLVKCDSCATRLCDDCITYKNIICVEGVWVCSRCVKELLEKKKNTSFL